MKDLEQTLRNLNSLYGTTLVDHTDSSAERDRLFEEARDLLVRWEDAKTKAAASESQLHTIQQDHDEAFDNVLLKFTGIAPAVASYIPQPEVPEWSKDDDLREKDKRRLRIYHATLEEDPDFAKGMENHARQAQEREDLRATFEGVSLQEIDAGIALRQEGDNLEIYLSVRAGKENEGYGTQLTNATMRALAHEQLPAEFEEYNGLVKLNVTLGEKDPLSLIDLLTQYLPETNGVTNHVLFTKRPDVTVQSSSSDLSEKLRDLVSDEAGSTSTDYTADSTGEEREIPKAQLPSYEQVLEEVPEGWLSFKDAAQLVGITGQSLDYHTDRMGKSVRTTVVQLPGKQRQNRFVDPVSLDALIQSRSGKSQSELSSSETAQVEYDSKQIYKVDAIPPGYTSIAQVAENIGMSKHSVYDAIDVREGPIATVRFQLPGNRWARHMRDQDVLDHFKKQFEVAQEPKVVQETDKQEDSKSDDSLEGWLSVPQATEHLSIGQTTLSRRLRGPWKDVETKKVLVDGFWRRFYSQEGLDRHANSNQEPATPRPVATSRPATPTSVQPEPTVDDKPYFVSALGLGTPLLESITEEHVSLASTPAITGRTDMWLGHQLTDEGGPVESTRGERNNKLVNLASLEVFLLNEYDAPTTMYTRSEASQVWKEIADRELGDIEHPDNFSSSVGGRISGGQLSTIAGENGYQHFSHWELDRYLVRYIAKKKMDNWDGDTILAEDLGPLLRTKNVSGLGARGKIDYDGKSRTVTVSSVKHLLNTHTYTGLQWRRKKVKKAESKAEVSTPSEQTSLPDPAPLEQRVEPAASVAEPVTQEQPVLSPAEILLGHKYAAHADKYGADTLTFVCESLLGGFSEDQAAALITADAKSTLFRQTESNLGRYFGQLFSFVQEIDRHFPRGVPDKYDFGCKTERFLPGKLNDLRRLWDKHIAGDDNSEQIIGEAAARLGYKEKLVGGLIETGFNPYFVDAMLLKGLHLQGSRPWIGAQAVDINSWEKDAGSALRDNDIAYRRGEFKRQKKKIDTVLLEKFASGVTKISLAPDWNDATANQKHLNNYLKLVVP